METDYVFLYNTEYLQTLCFDKKVCKYSVFYKKKSKPVSNKALLVIEASDYCPNGMCLPFQLFFPLEISTKVLIKNFNSDLFITLIHSFLTSLVQWICKFSLIIYYLSDLEACR